MAAAEESPATARLRSRLSPRSLEFEADVPPSIEHRADPESG